jgi:hypothetical protein
MAWHVELDDERKGVDWVIPWVVERTTKNRLHAVVVDEMSGLVEERHGRKLPHRNGRLVTLAAAEGRDMAIACAKFYDGIMDGSVRHTDQPQVNVACRWPVSDPLAGRMGVEPQGPDVGYLPDRVRNSCPLGCSERQRNPPDEAYRLTEGGRTVTDDYPSEITLSVPGLEDDETAVLNHLLAQLAQKSTRNLLRSSYYDGRRAIRQVGTVIPPQYAQIGLALGWAAKGVDGLARRCNIDEIVWPNGDLDSLGMSELLDRNFLLSELAQARTDSLLHGVSYLVTTRGDEDAHEPAALVHARDGLNATGDWNVRTRSLDNLLSVTSRKEGLVTGFVLYLNNLTISASKDGGAWTVERSEHPWGVPAEPLIYRPRASRRMGRSRINRPVMSIQDSALRALIRMEAHMDIYAIPKMIMLGADESIFKNADGSQKPSWQMAMGRAYGIPDDDDAQQPRADVKQFDASSPAPHLSQLNALAKLIARETDLPDSDFALTDMANPTSADAYNASRENLIAESEGAMDDWSVGIRRTLTRALAIQNDLSEIPTDWAGIAPKWRSPVYLSRAAAADAGAKQLASVPWLAETEVGLELLGLDAQQIQRALAEKRKVAGRAVLAALKPAVAPAQADALSA